MLVRKNTLPSKALRLSGIMNRLLKLTEHQLAYVEKAAAAEELSGKPAVELISIIARTIEKIDSFKKAIAADATLVRDENEIESIRNRIAERIDELSKIKAGKEIRRKLEELGIEETNDERAS